MKYKVIIKTCSQNSHRVHNCLNTWLKGLDYICLTDKITGEFEEISGSERNDYYSAEEKTVFMINHIKDNPDYDQYDWLAFIDDDAILNVKMFEYILPYLDKINVYGLKMIGCYHKDPTVIYPSGGSGYFISPSLIKSNNYMINQEWGVEDASVGKWMQSNNINFEDCYFIDNKKYYLKLNGWFPFPDEYNKLTHEELHTATIFPNKVIEYIEDHEKKKKVLLDCMTHHYIRHIEFMEYIQNCFKDWNPKIIENNLI